MTVGQIFWFSCQQFKYIGNGEKDVNDVIMQDLKDMVVLKFKTSLWGRWRNCRYSLTIPGLMGVKFAEFLCSALEGGTLCEIKSWYSKSAALITYCYRITPSCSDGCSRQCIVPKVFILSHKSINVENFQLSLGHNYMHVN